MRFVNPFSHIMSIFLQTDGIAPLPPAMNARSPLFLPPPRPNQEHAHIRTTCAGISPPRTRLSPCQEHAHVTDRDEHAIPSVAGTTHKTVPGRD